MTLMKAATFRHNEYIDKLWIAPEYAGGRLVRVNDEGKVECASVDGRHCVVSDHSVNDIRTSLDLLRERLTDIPATYDPSESVQCDLRHIPTLKEAENGHRAACMVFSTKNPCMTFNPEYRADLPAEGVSKRPDCSTFLQGNKSAHDYKYYAFNLQLPFYVSSYIGTERTTLIPLECSVEHDNCGIRFDKKQVPYYSDKTNFTNPDHMVSSSNFSAHMNKAYYRETARNFFAQVVGSGSNLIKHFTLIGNNDNAEYDVTVDLSLGSDVSVDLSSLEHYSADIDYMVQYFVDFLINANSGASGFEPVISNSVYMEGRPAAFIFDNTVSYVLLNGDLKSLTPQTRFTHYVEELGSAMLWELCRNYRNAGIPLKICMGRLGDEGARFASIMTQYNVGANALKSGNYVGDHSNDEPLVYSLVAEQNFKKSSPILLTFKNGSQGYLESYKPIDRYGDFVAGGKNAQTLASFQVGVDMPAGIFNEGVAAQLVYFAPVLRKLNHPTFASDIGDENVPTLWLRVSLQDALSWSVGANSLEGSKVKNFTSNVGDIGAALRRNHGIELPFQKIDGHWVFKKEKMVVCQTGCH